VDKLILAFTLFLSASGFAVHEARSASTCARAPAPMARADDDAAPTSPAIYETPPWMRYAAPAPPVPPPPAPPPPPTIVTARSGDTIDTIDPVDSDSEAVPDAVDRCPDQPEDNRDDDDGCPEVTES
jgi:hypothetical protein